MWPLWPDRLRRHGEKALSLVAFPLGRSGVKEVLSSGDRFNRPPLGTGPDWVMTWLDWGGISEAAESEGLAPMERP